MSEKYPEMLVGAGTVLTIEQVDRAVNAGAKFIVSPGFDAEIVDDCLEKNIPVFPGCITPSEVAQAVKRGLKVIKFFPAEQAGGVAMIKAMGAPYTMVKFMPTGGIYAALSEQSCETVLEAVKTAKKYGTIISYDLNYRPSMWSAIGGLEKAQEVNKEIVKYVDVMIGNEEDFTACLGLQVEGNDENLKELNLDGYKKMINEAAKQYPNFKVIATTLREVKTATVNDWSAICWADGEVYKAKDYKALEIMDRVGGGDSFASGLIYGLMTTENPELAVNYGAAHGALAMTTPGDTTMANIKEVEAIMGGTGARVQR